MRRGARAAADKSGGCEPCFRGLGDRDEEFAPESGVALAVGAHLEHPHAGFRKLGD